jgi:AraC family transcriptional regulator of adaptative response / DNA-3-methyladenine glycosylase II
VTELQECTTAAGPDNGSCYRAVASRDARFDGWSVTAVHTTGTDCRLPCPARTPLPANAPFSTTAAGAPAVGSRACRRCRPDAVPGSPHVWVMPSKVNLAES